MIQGRGGLKLEDIIAITKDYKKALDIAQKQFTTDDI